MKRNIIIDYLNIPSVLMLIMYERGSNVKALFRPQSKKLESTLIKIIRLFDINYSVDKMTFSNPRLSRSIANELFKRTGEITKSISDDYMTSSQSKLAAYFNFSLNKWFFESLWRQVSILVYVRKVNINVDTIYISTQIKSFLLMKSTYYQSELSRRDIRHYRSVCSIDDSNYSYSKKKPRIKYVGYYISSLIEMLYILFYVKLRIKVPYKKIDMLIFSHFTKYKWLGLDVINNSSTLNSKIVYPNKMIDADKSQFPLEIINWHDVFSFYLHMLNGVFKFIWAIRINLNLFIDLLGKWRYAFILDTFFKKNDVRIVLSGYESTFSAVATAVASDSKQMVSFDAVWSIGERPMEFAPTQHKMSDRYFLWGQWHQDLMKASNDKSSGYIIAGYVGDSYISKMNDLSKKFRNKNLKNYSKIITVFDNGSAEDAHWPDAEYNTFLKSILLISAEFNVLIVLKTKKGISKYDNIIKSHGKDRVEIHSEYGSLVGSLGSDIVIGTGASSPASVSAVHGAKTILYDPNKLVWEKWKSYPNSSTIISSLPNFEKKLRKLLLDDNKIGFPSPKFIDPFGDFKAQKRMEGYISDVFRNLHISKHEAIKLADRNYQLQWGLDKVTLRENLKIGI